MRIIRRSTLWGTIQNIFTTILVISIVILLVWFNNKYKQLEKINDNLGTTVDEQNITISTQTNTIKDLEANHTKLTNYISELETKIIQLEDEIKELSKPTKIETPATPTPKPLGASFKSFTDYRCLSKSSSQWKLQEQAYTDENGLRKINDAYLVALGSYYGTKLGTYYTVTLTNGNVFQIILCDCKNDIHTDAANQRCLTNGSIIEFYVDTSALPSSVKASGSIGSIDFFSGDILSIVPVQ